MPNYNLSGSAGSTFSLTFRARTCGGSIFNLSGYSISSSIRESYISPTGIASFVSTIVVPESGICNIMMNATGTAALPVGVLLYNVELSNSGGLNVLKPIEGKFLIYPDFL